MRAGPSVDDGADDLLVAKPGARFERVLHVQFKGILGAGDAGDAALRLVRYSIRCGRAW